MAQGLRRPRTGHCRFQFRAGADAALNELANEPEIGGWTLLKMASGSGIKAWMVARWLAAPLIEDVERDAPC